MCRAVVLFLVAECAQTTPMIAPLPGDPNFSIDGSVAFFKSGESNPTQPNPPAPGHQPMCHLPCSDPEIFGFVKTTFVPLIEPSGRLLLMGGPPIALLADPSGVDTDVCKGATK